MSLVGAASGNRRSASAFSNLVHLAVGSPLKVVCTVLVFILVVVLPFVLRF